jgi:RHS repeat-associated protein
MPRSTGQIPAFFGGQLQTYIDFIGYDEFGERTRVRWGNGVETRYERDPVMRRLSHVNTDDGFGTPIQRLAYEFNTVGNVTRVRNNLVGQLAGPFGGGTDQSFVYDELNQLTSASGLYRESNAFERRYTLAMRYDAIGNIVNKEQHEVRARVSGNGPPPMENAALSHTLGYEYLTQGNTRPHAPTRVGSRTLTYDRDGNQTGWTDAQTQSTRTLSWNEEDRVSQIRTDGNTVRFLYDGAGERTHKWSNAGTTVYASGYTSVRNGTQKTIHIFASGQRIASVVNPDNANGGRTAFFHTDHLGSTHFVTSEQGRVREHFEQMPFGEPWIEEQAGQDATPYRFTGKELDSETGLMYFGARYYDPRQAQWASVDPALGMELSTRNRWAYSYSWNSPVALIDRDGWDPTWTDTLVIRGEPHQVQFEILRGTGREIGGDFRRPTVGQTTDVASLSVDGPHAGALTLQQFVSVTIAFLHADNTWTYRLGSIRSSDGSDESSGAARSVPIPTNAPGSHTMHPDGTGPYPANVSPGHLSTTDQPHPDARFIASVTNEQTNVERLRGVTSPIVGGAIQQDLDTFVMDRGQPVYRSGFVVQTNFGVVPHASSQTTLSDIKFGTSNHPNSPTTQNDPTGTRMHVTSHSRIDPSFQMSTVTVPRAVPQTGH